MIALQTGLGPCGMMDRMGIGVGESTPNTQALEYARYIDEHFIQKGHLGVASGQGSTGIRIRTSSRRVSSEQFADVLNFCRES
jgi:hypothetical protein